MTSSARLGLGLVLRLCSLLLCFGSLFTRGIRLFVLDALGLGVSLDGLGLKV